MEKHLLYTFFVGLLFLQNLSAQSSKILILDGDGAYMSMADDDEIDIQEGENFSITCWVRTTSSSAYYRTASKRANISNSSVGYEMITDVNGGEYGINLRSVYENNAGPSFGLTKITDGVWHHLAMVVDGRFTHIKNICRWST